MPWAPMPEPPGLAPGPAQAEAVAPATIDGDLADAVTASLWEPRYHPVRPV